mmetsp:Transcript_540/g.1281  ORF Transcript_540/g.1281 Transcript_540/m.1281 type:complete len:501 (-) Transcript_540:999-2501(-)
MIPLAKDVERIIGLVKSSLGPKGMDKLLVSKKGNLKVTNDGSTILKNLACDSIASIIIRDISVAQDNEIGDGTTSVCCLAGELIREAAGLVSLKINPHLIIQGYRLAAKKALELVKRNSFNNSLDLELFCSDLLNLAKTTLSSKVVFPNKEHFARIAIKAVLNLNGSMDLSRISIIKKRGGSLKDSFLEEGLIFQKKIGNNQPKRILNPKILIANTPMDGDKLKILGTKVKVKTLTRLAQMEVGEQKKMLDKCKKIVFHGANVFVNRQLIYSRPEKFFTENGLISIEHADFEGIERLSLATGAEVISTFDEPSKVKLGKCKIVEEVFIGDETMVRFGGCSNNGACTIVLRGSNGELLEEAERSIHDTLCVLTYALKNPYLNWGGGHLETKIANCIENLSKKTPSKLSLVLEAFARSIEKIPKIILENGGFDSVIGLSKLKNSLLKKNNFSCIDITNGSVADAQKLGLIECKKLKTQTIISSVEAAEMIIRIDKMFLNSPK